MTVLKNITKNEETPKPKSSPDPGPGLATGVAIRIVRTDSQKIFGTLPKRAGIRDTVITASLSASSRVHTTAFVFFFVFIARQIYRTRETTAVGDSKGYDASLSCCYFILYFFKLFPGNITILLSRTSSHIGGVLRPAPRALAQW